MKEKKLPIGIQDFQKLLTNNFLYIDKTQYLYNMVTGGEYYFLSRPRRFGKSLLVSTLKEIFRGHKPLFKDLWIYNSAYEWKQYPIIHIDFSKMNVDKHEELRERISRLLDKIAEKNEIKLTTKYYDEKFSELIEKLVEKNKDSKVVILIDEYDKPIIDNIEGVENAVKIREVLKGFYSIIKSMDAYIRFVLLTGVTKFSKTGIFSGLNNLEDITMVGEYSSLLGITEEEIDKFLYDYIEGFSKKEGISKESVRNKLKEWYNGFRFSKQSETVYNPFSILLSLKNKDISNYWFDTGTPTFLIKLIKEKKFNITEIPTKIVSEDFSVFEVDKIELYPLLFQTGYLTIKDYDKETDEYVLDYPNKEVKNSFLKVILKDFSGLENKSSVYINEMVVSIKQGNVEKFLELVERIYKEIPYGIKVKQEKYYQTIFFLIVTLIGVKIEAEVMTDIGRIDSVMQYEDRVYVIEFKIGSSPEEAIAQIKEKRYYEKYQLNKITLIGISFSIEPKDGKYITYKIEAM